MTYITGATIKELREKKKMTQKQLADTLLVSDKTISKWETDKGLPDISILAELADALSVSVPELLTGNIAVNRNTSANLRRSSFYVCPVCGNILYSVGSGAFSCCGIRLPELEPESEDNGHIIVSEISDNDYYITLDHPMNKNHYISFIAYVTDSSLQMEKLYPEQTAHARFRRNGHGVLFAYCNKHGLYTKCI